mgnify:CR=1 FL=1
MLPTLIKPAQGGDSRGGNTSTASQIEYVLGQPFAYTVVLLKKHYNITAGLYNGK